MRWLMINAVLVLAVILTLLLNIKKGYNAANAYRLLARGIARSKNLVLIMFCLGALIAVWNAGGTIPSMILVGSSLVQGKFFLVLCFVVAAVCSLLIGTFIGALGTIGVALMGIGQSMGLEPSLIAGALVSGAVIGDRMSPLSGSANLTAEVTGTELLDNITFLIPTVGASSLIALLYYFYRGLSVAQPAVGGPVAVFAPQLAAHYNFSALSLLPPFLILVLAFWKRDIVHNLALTLAGSMILAAVLVPLPVLGLLKAAFFGVQLSIASPGQVTVLHGGGMLAMLPLNILIILVNILSAFWEASGVFERLTNLLSARLNGVLLTSLFTMLLSTLLAALFCNQTLAIIIPGKALGQFYVDKGLPKKLLVLDIADSGVVLSAVIPWHVMAVVAAGTLGVGASQYLPYAVLPWMLPIISMLFRIMLNIPKRSTVHRCWGYRS